MTTPEFNTHQPNQTERAAQRAPLLLRLAAGAGEVLINALGGTNPVDAIGREIDQRVRHQRAFDSAMASRSVMDDISDALGEAPDSPC